MTALSFFISLLKHNNQYIKDLRDIISCDALRVDSGYAGHYFQKKLPESSSENQQGLHKKLSHKYQWQSHHPDRAALARAGI
jgi:hypothetical protein